MNTPLILPRIEFGLLEYLIGFLRIALTIQEFRGILVVPLSKPLTSSLNQCKTQSAIILSIWEYLDIPTKY